MRTNPTGVARVRAGASAIGLGCHCTEGIFPVDAHCWSGVPGLWAAGDALCSRLSGAYYSNVGSSSSSAGVYGYHAGEQASDYASGRSRPVLSRDELDKAKNEVLEPRTRTTGFGPHWIQELVLQVYAPYWIHTMKHAERIKNALQTTEYIRDHIASKTKATDPHHNRLCHEAKHMVLLLEMKLRASLIREESRGLHFREDFPYRDDKNWLAWTACQKGSDGKMGAIKMPMPDRMKIDKDWTYTERYKINYPGEEEALAKLGIKI
jgi:succinate dehydrogenase/fumarate reductase flavoprotein subunit